jgi:hypothetical protein
MAVDAPGAQAAAALSHVTMRIAVEPAGIGVVYLLKQPVSALPIGAQPESLGQVAGFELSGGALRVTGGHPRDRFVVQFVPDPVQRDRVYPLLTRFEPASLVLHLPSIIPDPARFETVVDVEVAPGMTLLAGSTQVKPGDGRQTVRVDAKDRYVFIGPASGVIDAGFATIAGGGASPGLVRVITATLQSSLDDYVRGLEQPLGSRPIVVVAETSRDRPGNYGWRGDTTDNFMFLRFEGAGWSEPGARRQGVDIFVRHEAFHFWNGWAFRQEQKNDRPWLSEGGAEFAALGSALRHGVIDRGHFDDTMTRYLNECRELMGSRSLAVSSADSGRAPYACGTVAHWIASLRAQPGYVPFDEFLRTWRTLFAHASRGDRHYSVDSWRLELVESGDTAMQAVELITRDDGVDRWRALVPMLSGLGARIETRVPDAAKLRSQLLMHLLGGTCRGGYGFWGHDGFVKLDTGTRCAPLPADPEVDTVEGQNIFSDALGAYESALRLCADAAQVELARGNVAGPWKIDCRRPLPPPFEYRIGAPTSSRP